MIKFPDHLILHIDHNDHKSNYHSVEEENDWRGFDFRNDEQKQRCFDTDELWTMQWYPVTPIGFHVIAAPTLEELIAFANEGDFQ